MAGTGLLWDNSARAHGVHGPATPAINNCGLLDYFQYIYLTPNRPHNCNNIPEEFYDYQRDVGEAAASGGSSGGSAGSSSAAAAASGGATSAPASMPTGAPSASHVLGYVPEPKKTRAEQAMEEAQTFDERWDALPSLERSSFIRALGTLGRKDATPTDASIKIDSVGLMAGVDLISNQFIRIGLIGSINKVDVDIDENVTSLDIILPKGGVTASLEWNNWYLDGTGMYGPEYYDTRRFIDIDGKGDLREMSSHYTNHRITTAFEAGYRLALGPIVAQPHVGAQGSWLRQAHVVEQGNPKAAVHTAKDISRTGTTKVGLNLSTVLFWGNAPIVPTIGAGWTKRFGDLSSATTVSVDRGVSFEKVGNGPLRDLINVNASLSANINRSLYLNIGYSSSFNVEERTHSGSFGLRYSY